MYPRASFHIDKTNNHLFSNFEFLKKGIFCFPSSTIDCDMNSEIIQSVAYANYDDFQHVNFLFSQNFIPLFSG